MAAHKPFWLAQSRWQAVSQDLQRDAVEEGHIFTEYEGSLLQCDLASG